MRVLQVVSGLDLGGAQTHLVDLAAALSRQGVEVAVASGGGRLVERLERLGVPHHAIDFRVRGLRSLLRATRSVRALLDAGRFDIVHEHSFSPALAIHLATTGGPPRLLTLHGEERRLKLLVRFHLPRHVIAVSAALGQHARARLDPSSLAIIENGVDTQAFRPRAAGPADLAAAGLDRGDVAVVHVSRLSRAKAEVSLALLGAAPALAKVAPRLRVVVAGAGPRQDDVRRATAAANARAGRTVATFVGACPDPAPLYAAAAVVVATGRVALEALACARPVVAAGKYGVAGIVDEARFDALLGTNFGDNGAWPANTADELRPHVEEVLAHREVHAARAARLAEIVATRCSAETMARRVRAVYDAVTRSGS